MKYTFRLTRPDSDKPTAVYLDIHHNGTRVKKSTGFSIDPTLWDQERQAPTKDAKKIRKHEADQPGTRTHLQNIEIRLRDYLEGCNEYQKICISTGATNTAQGLKDHLTRVFDGETPEMNARSFLTDYMNLEYIPGIQSGKIQYKRNGKVLRFSPSTVKVKRQSLNALRDYEKGNPKIRFDKIDQSFYDRFVKWSQDQGHATNYTGRLIKEIKAVSRQAYEAGVHDKEISGRHFATLREDTEAIYLTDSELVRIENLDLPEPLAHYRNVFLVGCHTALRFSDYSRLTPSNIKERSGTKFIEIVTKKTRESVFIPIRPDLWQILNSPGYFDRKPVIEQKLNKHIKEICRLAEIAEPVTVQKIVRGQATIQQVPKYSLVTTHTARRTGATLMYKAGIPPLAIMKITGHKTEKNLLKYIRITKEESAEALAMHEYFTRPLVPKLKKVK